jgi:hypothetical protein
MKDTVNLKTTTGFPCGLTIKMVRTMTDKEMENEGWERRHYENTNPTCMVLSDDTIIYPAMDEEGNGPGAFFGFKDEQSYYILPPLPEDMEGK